MRLLLLVFVLLLGSAGWAQTPVEIQNGRLTFELGSVQVPGGTEWSKVAEKGKTMYMGSRQKEVYLVTVNKQKAVSAGTQEQREAAYLESYAKELGAMLGGKTRAIRSHSGKQGCEFSFKLSNGIQVIGNYRQGKEVALLISALNGSETDLKAMAASFQAAPGKFKVVR